MLKEYIKSDAHRKKHKGRKNKKNEIKLPEIATNTIDWRPPNIKHKKNECYMDVVEKLNMTVSKTGQVIKSEVLGTLLMNSQLSGMPELKLGLNDKALFEQQGKSTVNTVDMEDIKFHKCVRLNKFLNDRSISFVPPDGEFELMTYRIDMEVAFSLF